MVKGRGLPHWDAEGIRALRAHLGMTQERMARELGTRQQTISEWERGYYQPKGISRRLLSIVAEQSAFQYTAESREQGAQASPERLVLVQGDISQTEADALVNAANTHLWMGAGVAGALKRAGGIEIEREAMALAPVRTGAAVVTGAGRLKARYVIHAAVMGQDLQTNARAIQEATENSLRLAQELGVESIAFPALGTGVGGFPLQECARLMLETVRMHLAGPVPPQKVLMVLWGEEAYRTFVRVREELSPV